MLSRFHSNIKSPYIAILYIYLPIPIYPYLSIFIPEIFTFSNTKLGSGQTDRGWGYISATENLLGMHKVLASVTNTGM